MNKWNVTLIVIAGLVFAGSAMPARAQMSDALGGNLEGFAVAGKGRAAARPNRLEIDLEVTAASELSADAIVKYRDAKKRIQDAFTALKMKDVAVEERGLHVDQKGQTYNPYYMDMPPARHGKVEVQLKRKLVITCTNIRGMEEEDLLQLVAKLLDVAQDAGGKFGTSDFNPYYYNRYNQSNGLVRFILDDFDALQEKAYGEAIDDARAKARRLAKLSGVELGPVAGIREIIVPGENPNLRALIYGIAPQNDDDDAPRKQLVSTQFREIPVNVELQVRFSLTRPVKPVKESGER